MFLSGCLIFLPEIIPKIELSAWATNEDLADTIIDEYGVKYSRDGLRLLKTPYDIERYKIKELRSFVVMLLIFALCTTLSRQYFPCSTLVLPRQYCSTFKEVLKSDKMLLISSFLLSCSRLLFRQSGAAALPVTELFPGK